MQQLQRDVSPGVHRVETGPVNWYLVEDDDGVTIVDAGLPRAWSQLGWALAQIGRRPDDVRAVILTHAHFDHVGFVERARRELGVPVMGHPADASIARHPLRYPNERSRALYLRNPPFLAMFGQMAAQGALWVGKVGHLEPFADGDVLDVPGRPRVVATPGHTPGHVSFHLPERDTLIAGDAIVMLDVYTGLRGPRLVARAATADVAQNLASVDRIESLQAQTVLTGHGEPWRGGTAVLAQHARAAGSA